MGTTVILRQDMKVFENKVLQLMSEPSILRQMQLHALESAKKFSLESTMNKWEKMIQSSENS